MKSTQGLETNIIVQHTGPAMIWQRYYEMEGRAIAQAVSHWLPTAAARVRSRVWSSGICRGQSGAEAGFLRVLRFPLPIYIPPNSPTSQSPRAGYKWPISGRHAEWTQLDSTPH
jgi:hypothetical protein